MQETMYRSAVLWPWDVVSWLHKTGKFETWAADEPQRLEEKALDAWLNFVQGGCFFSCTCACAQIRVLKPC